MYLNLCKEGNFYYIIGLLITFDVFKYGGEIFENKWNNSLLITFDVFKYKKIRDKDKIILGLLITFDVFKFSSAVLLNFFTTAY